MSVNVRLLRSEIAFKGGKQIASRANTAIKAQFERKKDAFLKAFDEDEVTQEIEAGPHADSHFIETPHGGNLFSLIGFEESQEPIPALREMLDDSITIDLSKKQVSVSRETGRIEIETPVSIPTLEEIYVKTAADGDTQVPWNKGRSFVNLIQKGITGFGSYLAGTMFANSRSGGGVQATNEEGGSKQIRDADLGGIPYLNRLLRAFKDSFRPKS